MDTLKTAQPGQKGRTNRTRCVSSHLRTFLPSYLLIALLLGGCAAPGARRATCPGKANVEEARAALAVYARQAVSFRANGQLLLTYHDPDSGRQRRHNLPMQMWFNPPWDTYLQGSVGLDPRAAIIGSNEQSFWLTLRPQEMSSYYLGDWEDARTVDGLMMSPRVVLEAFGVVEDEASGVGAWSLQHKSPYDILTRRDDAGHITKRVYVDACDYLVRRIEYFDRREDVIGTAVLSNYEPLTEQFRVPKRIVVTAMGPAKQQDAIDITLTSMRVMEFSEPLRARIFNPPESAPFENVYIYVDGGWVRR